MCLNKEKGGLGVRGILDLNRAFLGKWSWRFVVEDNTPRNDLIKTKYEIDKGVDHPSFKCQIWGWPLEGN